jgi:hypothetical protein
MRTPRHCCEQRRGGGVDASCWREAFRSWAAAKLDRHAPELAAATGYSRLRLGSLS